MFVFDNWGNHFSWTYGKQWVLRSFLDAGHDVVVQWIWSQIEYNLHFPVFEQQ
jgi:hypothetical protein